MATVTLPPIAKSAPKPRQQRPRSDSDGAAPAATAMVKRTPSKPNAPKAGAMLTPSVKAATISVATGAAVAPPPPIPRAPKLAADNRSHSAGGRLWYTILPGNNSRVVIQAFRNRAGWSPTPADHSLQDFNFVWEQHRQKERFTAGRRQRLVNHLEHNHVLTSKKGLFQSLAQLYSGREGLFNVIPPTFLVTEATDADEGWVDFKRMFASLAASSEEAENKDPADMAAAKSQCVKNVWIVKPAAMTNRGQGISVVNTVEEVADIVSRSKKRSWIVQKYLEHPLLVHGRKFDIRCYVLLTTTNNGKGLKGYLFNEGYIRTSSKKFSLDSLSDKFVHLTNDAIQKHGETYGKFEEGNKMSYTEFATYLGARSMCIGSMTCIGCGSIKSHVVDSLAAVADTINADQRYGCFEMFGYDFMLDDKLNAYLIEVNTNPCLEIGCPLLGNLIPRVIEHTLRRTVDVMFPPLGAAGKASGAKASKPKAEDEESKSDVSGPSSQNDFEPVFKHLMASPRPAVPES